MSITQYELTSSFDQMTFQNNVVLRNYDLSNKHGNSNTCRLEQMVFKKTRHFLNKCQYKLKSFQTNVFWSYAIKNGKINKFSILFHFLAILYKKMKLLPIKSRQSLCSKSFQLIWGVAGVSCQKAIQGDFVMKKKFD